MTAVAGDSRSSRSSGDNGPGGRTATAGPAATTTTGGTAQAGLPQQQLLQLTPQQPPRQQTDRSLNNGPGSPSEPARRRQHLRPPRKRGRSRRRGNARRKRSCSSGRSLNWRHGRLRLHQAQRRRRPPPPPLTMRAWLTIFAFIIPITTSITLGICGVDVASSELRGAMPADS